MASSRSNRSLIIGLVVLIVGAALTFIVLQQGGDDDASSEPEISAEEQAAIDARNEALAAQQAAGQAGGQPLVEGQPLTSLIPRPLTIPEGFEALSITLDFDGAVAGLPAAGDALNLYGVFAEIERLGPDGTPLRPDGSPFPEGQDSEPQPGVKLLAANVEVLAATGVAAQSQAGGNLTVVLAVDPISAETLILQKRFAQIHATLVRPDAVAPQTDGQILGEALSRQVPDLKVPDPEPTAEPTDDAAADEEADQ